MRYKIIAFIFFITIPLAAYTGISRQLCRNAGAYTLKQQHEMSLDVSCAGE